MQIARIMTKNPFTIGPKAKVTEAQALMRRERIHRLPVVDGGGRLVGIISEKDLLNVSPSPASTLDMYEMSALLAKITVDSVMTKKTIVADEACLIEDAARMLVDNDIGGLPVVNKDHVVVGIVTESDLFKLFIESFGSRKRGLRITCLVPERQGELAELTGALSAKGGNIISLGTFPGEDSTNSIVVIKLEGLEQTQVSAIIEPLIVQELDIREV
ncbi:CBS and ACT domain-containing protein [Spirochaeta lutea]|uniref:CBS domain-containing protein n=1 Tax=Spirochaeta lutea TaxID=1480694 RepID=A0A098QW78_9SPIO|nr:CBS and ACT domain-containing protein [Spirochaeta lutea]KGE71663.1 hypothetical protein DC28_10380 [Spirochaeta lutea]